MSTEEVVEKLYWLISTKPIEKFKIALKKIGMNDDQIKDWIEFFETDPDVKNVYKIYIIKHFYSGKPTSYNYQHLDSIHNHRPGFQGEIVVEDWEVDVEKYNL